MMTQPPTHSFGRVRASTEDSAGMDVAMESHSFRGGSSLASSLGPPPTGSSSSSSSSAAHHEERFRLYNEVLIHAASCHDNLCMMSGGRCHKVKVSIDHFARCYGPRRNSSPIESCPTCARIWTLLCYHAKSCPTQRGQHCIVANCDYLRDKIERKRQQDQAELQRAQNLLQSQNRENWPVERRIAQLEADRQQVMTLIEQIRSEKARQLHQRSMTL